MHTSPRLAARALIVENDKLLLVNATPDNGDGKWCVPGGGIDIGENIKNGLKREIYEETGMSVEVRDLAAVSEFMDDENQHHQVDLFFKCRITEGELRHDWQDHTNVVAMRDFFDLRDIQQMNVLPSFLKTDIWLKEEMEMPVYKGHDKKRW